MIKTCEIFIPLQANTIEMFPANNLDLILNAALLLEQVCKPMTLAVYMYFTDSFVIMSKKATAAEALVCLCIHSSTIFKECLNFQQLTTNDEENFQ